MLNPQLFQALRLSHKEVEIKNENEVADYKRQLKKVVLANGKTINRVRYEHVLGGRYGEKYVMNCPFCGDTKKRFSVSYLYATRDPATQQFLKIGLHCFNETECHRDRANREDFFDRVRMSIDYQIAWSGESVKFEQSDAEPVEEGEKAMPGYCVSICDLPLNSPANQYLIDRGFDVQMAGEIFGVSQIVRPSKWGILQDRLLVPFNRNGYLIGWCARAMGEDHGRKYINSPGGLGGFLYGLSGAVGCKVLCIVEGCLDRWSVGQPGVALLTATLGHAKQQRLQQAVLSSGVELVVVLGDPKQPEQAAKLGKEHPLDVLTKHLSAVLAPVPVLPVWLPQWLDTGACHGDYLANYLKAYLREKGYERLGEILARDVQSSSATRPGLH